MWASHSRVSLRQTPRYMYGVDETFASVSPLRVYSNSSFFYFRLDTLKTEHFEGLKHVPHRSAQSYSHIIMDLESHRKTINPLVFILLHLIKQTSIVTLCQGRPREGPQGSKGSKWKGPTSKGLGSREGVMWGASPKGGGHVGGLHQSKPCGTSAYTSTVVRSAQLRKRGHFQFFLLS